MIEEADFDAECEAEGLTIECRVAKGRITGNCRGGAIVPFPTEPAPEDILLVLHGKERAKVQTLFSSGYRLTTYNYRAADGSVIQSVLRFDHHSNPKEIRPLIYLGRGATGLPVHAFRTLQTPRPLYALDQISKRPDAPVLVVEGEKTAEAAAKKFPDYVVTTWPGGASNARNNDLSALTGRQLTLWPDNDEAGRRAMLRFAVAAHEAGAGEVRLVAVPETFGEKWDLADEPPVDFSEVALRTLLENARILEASDLRHVARDGSAAQRRLLGYQPGYSRAPIDSVANALSVLDPDMGWHEWSKIARCIYYAYGEAGLATFDTWSKGSTAKYKEGEPARMWQAFESETGFRARPLAWLLHRAKKVLLERSQTPDGAPNVEVDSEALAIAEIEALSEDHAVVLRGGKTAVLRESFDPRFGWYAETYLSKKDFVDQHVRLIELAAEDAAGKPKQKLVPLGHHWFSTSRRRSYKDVLFAPGQDLGRTVLNLWRGFSVEPAGAAEGWSRFREHIRANIACNDEAAFAYILNWMAFAVQHLEKPIGVALILIGPKGAGKTLFTRLFGHLFGRHLFMTSRMDDVVGRFNDRLETTLVLGLEEAIAPRSRAADGTLKDLLTRETLRLEGKFYGVWDAPNHLRVIVTSNNDQVVRADGHDRRYAVFEVQSPHQSSPEDRRRFFGELVEQMQNGGYEAMLGELLQRDISDWNPEAIPQTAALKRQQELNLINDPVRAFLFERLSDGTSITTGDAGSSTPIYEWSKTEAVIVPAADLQEDFRAYLAKEGLTAGPRALAVALPKYMPASFRVTTRVPVHDSSTRNVKAYRFPPLEEARTLFETATGLSIPREGEAD